MYPAPPVTSTDFPLCASPDISEGCEQQIQTHNAVKEYSERDSCWCCGCGSSTEGGFFWVWLFLGVDFPKLKFKKVQGPVAPFNEFGKLHGMIGANPEDSG